MGKLDLLKICGKCGGHCCSYGGTTATKEEVDKIVQAGFDNHFEKLSDDVFITKWGGNGVCPYLKNKACSIHPVRPTLCKCFPVLMLNENDFYLQHCPLLPHISKEEIENSKKILKKVPSKIINGSSKYLKPYEKILSKRISRYKLEKIK